VPVVTLPNALESGTPNDREAHFDGGLLLEVGSVRRAAWSDGLPGTASSPPASGAA
jgi:hypothetical protein